MASSGASATEKVYSSPDWPNARELFPDWLWSGLVSEAKASTGDNADAGGSDMAALDHARGLFGKNGVFLLERLRDRKNNENRFDELHFVPGLIGPLVHTGWSEI